MSLSSFCVVMNALRLNLFDIRKTTSSRPRPGRGTADPGREQTTENADREEAKDMEQDDASNTPPRESREEEETIRKYKQQEETEMKKTMKIEGMMCEHCEARVKKVLEAVNGVESAEVSHVQGSAVVTLSGPVEDAVLKKAVEDQDYQVLEIA